MAALSGHGPAVAAQFALTEGLPAAAVAVIAVTWPDRPPLGSTATARFALVAGLAAAVISALRAGPDRDLGARPGAPCSSARPLDAVKMLALALLAAAAAMTALPAGCAGRGSRWPSRDTALAWCTSC